MKKLIKVLWTLSLLSVLAQFSLVAGVSVGFPPVLFISPQSGNQVMLSWQDANNWLQSSPDLFTWLNVPGTPTFAGGTNTVTLPTQQQAMFFRLVNSPGLPPPTELVLGADSDIFGNYYFELAWDPVPGAVSYNVYLASFPGVDKSSYSAVINGVTNSYAYVPDVPEADFLPGLTAGVRYYFVVTAVSASAEESANSNPVSGIYGPNAAVSGSVFTALSLGTNVTDVNLAGVVLTLTNQANPSVNATTTSDMDGNFSFSNMPAGNYNLCWHAGGFMPGCSNTITISNADVDVDAIQLYPNPATGFVYGQLSYQDGTALTPWNDNFFQINVSPAVKLADSHGHVLAVARANSSGQYVMAGVPAATNLSLSLTVEGASVVSNINTAITGEADFVLPDTPPLIESIAGTTNGVRVYNVPAGTTVQVGVAVNYSGSGNLAYEWFNPDGTVAPYPSATNISWPLPVDADGFQYLFVRVSDGRGGYDTARLELTTDDTVLFSGTVLDATTGFPLTNAVVRLNNSGTNTDTNGNFSFTPAITNEYDLSITCPGYAPMANVFFEGAADEIYTLLPISPPAGVGCETSVPLIMATNFGNGVSVSIPTDGLLDTNDNPYFGCVRVTLDTLDPCNPTNYFGDGDLMTNGNTFQPQALANIGVWDVNDNPLHLAPGYLAEIFLPIVPACVDTNFPAPSAAGFFTLLNPPANRWAPVGSGNLVTNNYGANTFIGYDGFAGALALLEAGPPPAPAPAPTVNLQFNVDTTLHVPLRVGLFQDNGKGAPDQKQPVLTAGPNAANGYVDIDSDGYVLKNVTVPAGKIIWIEVLNLRQAPGAYYGTAAAPLADGAKEIIQALKLTVANPPDPIPVTLGLGVTVDVPRSVEIAQLDAARVKSLATKFLIAREPGQDNGVDAKDYYKKVDPGSLKTTFTAWQTANGWTKTGIGTGGDDAYALYFNANDLGAGRRMGMKIFTDDDKEKSVAYYVATYDTLADAEKAEGAQGQFGAPLKYIVCMEFSLTLSDAKPPKPVTPRRYIKFYAYDQNGKITGMVPNEARGRTLTVPQVCMECHGAGTDKMAKMPEAKQLNAPHGEVLGQFVAFDTANYTFSQKGITHDSLFKAKTFTALNNGLLTSQAPAAGTPYMPANLFNLIKAIADPNYTTAPPMDFTQNPPAASKWGNNAGPPSDADLYNKVYAVSCRSCHVTQPGGAVPGVINFSAAKTFDKKVNEKYDAQSINEPVMPHAQRTFGIFYGSATAAQLNATIPANPTGSQLKLLFGADPKFK